MEAGSASGVQTNIYRHLEEVVGSGVRSCAEIEQ